VKLVDPLQKDETPQKAAAFLEAHMNSPQQVGQSEIGKIDFAQFFVNEASIAESKQVIKDDLSAVISMSVATTRQQGLTKPYSVIYEYAPRPAMLGISRSDFTVVDAKGTTVTLTDHAAEGVMEVLDLAYATYEFPPLKRETIRIDPRKGLKHHHPTVVEFFEGAGDLLTTDGIAALELELFKLRQK
jgi:hypothetical protein